MSAGGTKTAEPRWRRGTRRSQWPRRSTAGRHPSNQSTQQTIVGTAALQKIDRRTGTLAGRRRPPPVCSAATAARRASRSAPHLRRVRSRAPGAGGDAASRRGGGRARSGRRRRRTRGREERNGQPSGAKTAAAPRARCGLDPSARWSHRPRRDVRGGPHRAAARTEEHASAGAPSGRNAHSTDHRAECLTGSPYPAATLRACSWVAARW